MAKSGDIEYLDRYALALGKLVGNLSSLESAVRIALHYLNVPADDRAPTFGLSDVAVGDTVLLTSVSKWASLGGLIADFNGHHRDSRPDLLLDEGIVDIRNAFAHGMVSAESTTSPLILLKFGSASGDRVPITAKYTLTEIWMADQVKRVYVAIDKVQSRLDELAPFPPTTPT